MNRRSFLVFGLTAAAGAALAASPESIRAFHGTLLNSCALFRPPQKLSIAEWADKYGMLSAEGSARPGKFSLSTAEYQREPLECLSPGSGFDTVVQMWSSQTGKTQNALWFAAYHIEHDPAPILFVEPDENLAKTIAKDRVEPMIRDTPELAPLFANAGSKRGGNDTLRKSFPGGQITFAWASSPTGLASRPIRILITDEEGAYDAAPNKEGNPVQLAIARMATFATRKHLRVSSPRLKRTCLITQAFEQSDQRHFYVPCPQCGHMQTLRFDQLKWPYKDGKPDSAACYYVCEQNGCEITHADKFRMIRQGKWIAHKPGGGDGRTAGFHLNALYSTIGFSWSNLVDKFHACENLPERLQAFTNTLLGLPWDEQAEGADMGEIQKHAEDYAAEAPAGVIMVTCGADVQKDRIEGSKWGWGLNHESWLIEHRVFHGDPLGPDVWRAFEAWRGQYVAHELGITLPTVCTFVDSGDGNRQQSVLEYTKSHERLGVRACKGASQQSAPLVSEARRVGRIKALQVLIGGSVAKNTLYGRFQIYDKTRPGAVHFPRHISSGASAQYFKHLTAEVLVTHQTRAGEVSRWENPHKRNEALDCAVYAYAAKEFTRANLPLLESKMLAKVEVLRGRNELLQVSAPERVSMVASALSAPSPSSASCRASASPAKRRPLRRRFKLPGANWVGNLNASADLSQQLGTRELVEFLIRQRDQCASLDQITEHFCVAESTAVVTLGRLQTVGRVEEFYPGRWHLE